MRKASLEGRQGWIGYLKARQDRIHWIGYLKARKGYENSIK